MRFYVHDGQKGEIYFLIMSIYWVHWNTAHTKLGIKHDIYHLSVTHDHFTHKNSASYLKKWSSERLYEFIELDLNSQLLTLITFILNVIVFFNCFSHRLTYAS